MKPIIDYHHFQTDLIDVTSDRVAIYERFVVDMLLNSNVGDKERESSIAFELKHHHSTAQFARLLARQRGLSIDVCTVGALLHDIYVIKYGGYKDHAHQSAIIAADILDKLGGFSFEEKEQILLMISNHSDKDVWSENPYEEIGKDADILDCFLYPNTFGYYLIHKKLSVFYNYVLRAKKIWSELKIPLPKDFSIFDYYSSRWLDYKLELKYDLAKEFLGKLCYSYVSDNQDSFSPTVLIKQKDDLICIYINSVSYKMFELSSKEYLPKKNNYSEAEDLISKAKGTYVAIWSAIDSYEVLEESVALTRLIEFGVPNTDRGI